MEVEFHNRGIYLPQIDLWLDSTEDAPCCWISHGHSDHARGLHGCVYGTRDTLEFYRMRNVLEGTPREPDYRALAYGESFERGGAKLTAVPASHILGAAQLLVEYRGERLVYTGDIKLRAPLCGVKTEVVPCDRLIIESTFGLPIYRFLAGEEAAARMVEFAQEALDEGSSPVFVGYPLGRGQEIAHVLATAGIPVAVHGSIARFIPAYERAGYPFPNWTAYSNREIEGRALVVTPEFRNYLESSGKDIRVAYVSGWAALDNARARAQAEVLIPYSDHADFAELMEMVERSGAREVDVVHGYTEAFARLLRTKGIDARTAGTGAGSVEQQEG
jgi:Cft2 family RNA processing exonuclease